jgi:hypothetical protein
MEEVELGKFEKLGIVHTVTNVARDIMTTSIIWGMY